MKHFLVLIIVVFTLSCKGQVTNEEERKVGGPCEDCVALMDYQKLNIQPLAVDTLPRFNEHEPKIKISGTVYKRDGSTPAENTILYIYHVDRNGLYQPSDDPVGWEKRHGQYRAWLKTGKDGKFTFYTFRPASYPGTSEPQHIHIYVKEPHTIPYYLDSYLFESDPLLTESEKSSQKDRGGSGIIKLEMRDGIYTANRDLILGLNIPEYE
ncbi:peptidase associated/transthyretin-like domain-containing protein [Winogradskyella tangerina]|uniref:intradiol ring-cleavage dioxygenase n=1 Tax=Winogradskyella tangerina TaxID=2023240 RepID=UPI000DBE7E7D|nr:intradiol ring-cleavage dioxygenase [Winogradskyella tangerina]